MTIVPFEVQIDETVIAAIRARMATARFPRGVGDGGWSHGISHDFMRAFVNHFSTVFDWRTIEAQLNAWPQFTTSIHGSDLHFFHVAGKGGKARPLLLLHGWPSSVFEFVHLIGPLTDPVRFGGRAEDAFTVIIPSLPGFGFSPIDDRVLGPVSVAAIMDELMERLGHRHYAVQGGDFGAAVSVQLADRHPDKVKAMHLNAVLIAARPIDELTAEELAYLDESAAFTAREFDYLQMQTGKPNNVAFALADNPLGAAAWILEKFHAWSDHGGDLLDSFTLDQLSGAVAMYLFTDTLDTSIRIYPGLADELGGAFRPDRRITVPTAAALFPREVRPAAPPRSWAEKQYNLCRWTEMPNGGHFAALEQPALFLSDVRDFLRDRL